MLNNKKISCGGRDCLCFPSLNTNKNPGLCLGTKPCWKMSLFLGLNSEYWDWTEMMCKISKLCLNKCGHFIPLSASFLVGRMVRNIGPRRQVPHQGLAWPWGGGRARCLRTLWSRSSSDFMGERDRLLWCLSHHTFWLLSHTCECAEQNSICGSTMLPLLQFKIDVTDLEGTFSLWVAKTQILEAGKLVTLALWWQHIQWDCHLQYLGRQGKCHRQHARVWSVHSECCWVLAAAWHTREVN